MSMILHYIYLIVALFYFLSPGFCRTLTFSKEGTFTILQLTDLHYGESTYTDENNMRLQTELIKRVQPDVVVVTGDVLSGYAYNGQPNFFEEGWMKFGKAFIDNQVYYAFAMGNHDAQDDTDPEVIYELEKKNKFSLCAQSEDISHENFNYYLPVYSGLNKGSVSAMLWIFDSHSVGCVEDYNSWGCIGDSQIEWYKQHAKGVREKYGTNIHHLGFFHIPFPEYMELYNNHEFYGHRNEDVSCPLLNTGFFQTLKSEGEIQAVFVGHDHLNDFGGWYNGIELVYGRRMGYAGYGHIVGFQRGARVIKLKEKSGDGTIKVERDHYVIVENPGKNEEDRWSQKELKVRKGPKQVVCVVGGGTESLWLTLVWIIISIALMAGIGFLTNLGIAFLSKHRQKGSSGIQAKRRQSGDRDEESMKSDVDLAI